jgi:hypothetical protein
MTRQQLAVMLYRYAGEPEVTGNLSGFPDAGGGDRHGELVRGCHRLKRKTGRIATG